MRETASVRHPEPRNVASIQESARELGIRDAHASPGTAVSQFSRAGPR